MPWMFQAAVSRITFVSHLAHLALLEMGLPGLSTCQSFLESDQRASTQLNYDSEPD